MSGMHMKEFSPTVMCAVRTIEVNRYLENMCGLYKEEDSLTVMCPVRTTKVKRNLENTTLFSDKFKALAPIYSIALST